MNFTTAAAAKFVQDCQAQNYNPIWGTSEQAAGKDLLSLRTSTPSVRPTRSRRPRTELVFQTFRDAMSKYAKGSDWKEGSGSFAWAGLEALHKALANVGSDRRPGRTCMTALGTIQSDDLGGLLPNKVTFDPKKPAGYFSHPCSFVLEIKDGKLTSPAGTACASLS